MGCCGKKPRGLMAESIPRGQVVREMPVRPRSNPVPPPSGMVAKSNTTIQPNQNVLCKKCGARLLLKRIWSTRLRRNYDVLWCPACQKEE